MEEVTREELNEKLAEILEQDEYLGSYALKARCDEAGVVQLQGIVDVWDEKQQATVLLSEIPGVKRVENQITVCTDGAINDREVALEVSEELLANPEVPKTVGCQVHGGEVQLVGTVSSLSEAHEAVESAGKARGVCGVKSQLRLAEEFDDITISNNVLKALHDEPELIPGRIKVKTLEGKVTLQGQLPEKQVNLALEIAAKVPGVRAVESDFGQEVWVKIEDHPVVKVLRAIGSNSFLKEKPLGFEVENGKVSVFGSITDSSEKIEIEKNLASILADLDLPADWIENRIEIH